METLKLKSYHLDPLMKVINYPMAFFKGRIKNRFMAIVLSQAQALEKNRLEILTALCEKDADGKPIVEQSTDEKGKPVSSYKLSDENKVKWNEEFNKMMTEECVIDITPSLKTDLGPIKDIINTSPVELDNNQVMIIEEVITVLELTKPKAKSKK